MRTWATTLVDALFPPSANERCLRTCTQEQFSMLYHPQYQADVHTLLPYEEPVVKASIHLAKFHNHPVALSYLGAVLAQHLERLSADAILVPIPLGRKRLHTRGYNQVISLIEAAHGAGAKQAVCPNLLTRVRETTPQTSLKRAARLANVQGVFQAHNGARLEDRPVVIIDDVSTTGATLAAARAAFSPFATGTITCVALAG